MSKYGLGSAFSKKNVLRAFHDDFFLNLGQEGAQRVIFNVGHSHNSQMDGQHERVNIRVHNISTMPCSDSNQSWEFLQPKLLENFFRISCGFLHMGYKHTPSVPSSRLIGGQINQLGCDAKNIDERGTQRRYKGLKHENILSRQSLVYGLQVAVFLVREQQNFREVELVGFGKKVIKIFCRLDTLHKRGHFRHGKGAHWANFSCLLIVHNNLVLVGALFVLA